MTVFILFNSSPLSNNLGVIWEELGNDLGNFLNPPIYFWLFNDRKRN
jgi:hypothetical protein